MATERATLPRPIAILIVSAIAGATLLALAWPALPWADARRITVGPSRVGIIVAQRDGGGAGALGARAPDFEWVAPDGRRVALSSLGRPVVINFWATWCEPCKREMPLLDRVAAARADIAFLAIDLDEEGAQVRAFLDGARITHLEPLLDVGLETSRRYGLVSVPSTVFLDAGGTIRHVQIGEMDEDKLAVGLAAIR